MTRTRKDGTKQPTRAEWTARAAALREAADELQRLVAASTPARQVAAAFGDWLERRAKQCERRAARVKPGRPAHDQLTLLANWHPPGQPGRPRTGHIRDANTHTGIEQWRDAQEQQAGKRPSVTEACRAVVEMQPRRDGPRPTVDAIRAAYNRHERRSRTSPK